MKPFRILVLYLALFALASAAAAASVPGTDFPYASFRLQLPPAENPFPGFGNYHSALSRGIDSIFWNPASLAKIDYAGVSFSTVQNPGVFGYGKSYDIEDKIEKIADREDTKIGIFLTGDPTVTTPVTRENTAHVIYSDTSLAMDFKQALKINDWLTLGFISRSDTNASIDMTGEFPVVGRFTGEYANTQQSISNRLSAAIDNNGFASFTITPEGGVSYTRQLSEPLWSGFLNQSSVVPASSYLDAKNEFTFSSPWTMAAAGRLKNLSVGMSLTPISANCNVYNHAWTAIDAGTPDMIFYQPNLDPNNESSILNWVGDPAQYATEKGYKKNTIVIPAGDVIAEARFQGFYQASTSRIDLGATYDLGDNFTFGLALENVTGATLDFKGSGRVAYVNSRVGSLEAPSLDPTKEFSWNLFSDTYQPAGGTENFFLEEQLNAQLPKIVRLGIAIKKPLLIALDYEQNQSPINYKYEDTTTKQVKIGTVSGINLLRTAAETRLFSLPVWLRGSITLMFKPNLENFEQSSKDALDKAFQFGVLPVGLDLGTEFNIREVIFGDNLGFNLTPLISLAQADALNQDLNKMAYYDIFARYGQWQFNYLMSLDPAATAGAYANRADKTIKDFKLEYIKWMQTFTVSYKF